MTQSRQEADRLMEIQSLGGIGGDSDYNNSGDYDWCPACDCRTFDLNAGECAACGWGKD